MSRSAGMKLDVDRFFEATRHTFLEPFHPELKRALSAHVRPHGRSDEWDAVIAQIPESDHKLAFRDGLLSIGPTSLDIEQPLLALKPWRKGPVQLGGSQIDTEWRSDWKWDRVLPHLSDLSGRQVLDIGCGNGYFLLRMLQAGASLALGVDPTILFNYQFCAMQKLLAPNPAYLLPLRGEHLPAFGLFDTVFSMGVLYHRRDPETHIRELASFLRPGGELVLETLVVDGDADTVLMPEDRYAQMRNVWYIPSPARLEQLLLDTGLKNVRTVDVTRTTTEEQRPTAWMDFQSLPDFLDPADPDRTIEGYPAPTRAVVVAQI